jgi:AraC-like DNA-binding protein
MTDRAPTNIDISPSATAGGVTEAQPGGPVTSKSWEALPDLLDTIHCETYSFFTASYAAPWALSFSGQGEVFSYELREGSAIIEIAGAEFVLEVGDLCLIPHGKPHKLYSGAESKGAAIGHAICRVDVQRANPLLKLLPFALIFRAEDGALVSWMRTMAGFIEDLRNSTDPGDQAILRRMTEAAIIRAIQEYFQSEHAKDRTFGRAALFRITPVLRAIHRAPEKKWSVASLAREAGMSRTVFATTFAETMGETPAQYLLGVRMAVAQDLLRSSPMSLSDVAWRVGYANEGAFGRAFKRYFGISPINFRASEVVSDFGPET